MAGLRLIGVGLGVPIGAFAEMSWALMAAKSHRSLASIDARLVRHKFVDQKR